MSLTEIRQGSSKNIFASADKDDELFFQFSNRVSVFDYGALEENIEGKAECLFEQAKYFDAHLKANGFETLTTNFDEAKCGYWQHKAKHFEGSQILDPNAFYFIPLEVIFRWGVPKGSSYLKRNRDVEVGTRFSEPVIEFFTKLEDQDRHLQNHDAAKYLPDGLSIEALREYAERFSEILLKDFSQKELILWDGKIEVAWKPATKKLYMVDALGVDELRLSHPLMPEIPLSKELIRQWYLKTNWSYDVHVAKAKALKEGSNTWRTEVYKPPRLGQWRMQTFVALYQALTKVIVDSDGKALIDWLRFDQSKPKVHIVGAGGREEALRWRLVQEGAQIVDSSDQADATWVSMDADLEAAMVNNLEAESKWVYGPRKEAAKIEWSKFYGRKIANEAQIPGPMATQNISVAKKIFTNPPVVKKNSLAGGKGVVVCESWDEAQKVFDTYKNDGDVVIEERWKGPEASVFFAIESSTGKSFKAHYLGSAKDYKRRFEGDIGPNTGGMGAWAPHPQVGKEEIEVFREWTLKMAELMSTKGVPFNGIVFLGLMKDREKGWGLLEFNARFGDPETQALVSSWDSKKVLRSLLALSVDSAVKDQVLVTKSICLSLVNSDYPGKAKEIELPEWNLSTNSPVLKFETSSKTGRLAYLVGSADSFPEAADEVFATLSSSPWKDFVAWRKDILP